MKRMKKHKKKPDRPATSRSTHHDTRAPDLTYFIHDRVELLHQAFSALKPKEVIAMAPDSVRNLPLDNLQELCLEELLGISSKRLCAILDGGAPPSDTDSSSNSDKQGVGNLDNLSLESISSDEAALGPETMCVKEKKRKRCKRRESKKLKEKNKEKDVEGGSPGDHTRTAERAGLTVLELLELQARARAIRAQLQAERKKNEPTATITGAQIGRNSDDDDVEIKEEPAVVVELSSSDDEKPNLRELQQQINSPKPEPEPKPTTVIQESTQTITKRNDLTIIVPKPPTSKKIKLNRQKSTVVIAKETVSQTETRLTSQITSISSQATHDNETQVTRSTENKSISHLKEVKKTQDNKKKKNKVKKKKKDMVRKDIDAEGSDQDEISLQLSDSEKMDLFEDFDRRSSDDAEGSSSEDSANTSTDESDKEKCNKNVEIQNKFKELTNLKNQRDLEKRNDEHYETIKLTPELPEASNKTETNLPCVTTNQLENLNLHNVTRLTEVFEEVTTSVEKAANDNMKNNERADDDKLVLEPAQNKMLDENNIETRKIKQTVIKDGQRNSSDVCDEIQEPKGTTSEYNQKKTNDVCIETQKLRGIIFENSQEKTKNTCEETLELKVTVSEDRQEKTNVVFEDSKESKGISKVPDSKEKSREFKEMIHKDSQIHEDSQKNCNDVRETKTVADTQIKSNDVRELKTLEDTTEEVAAKTDSEQTADSEIIIKKPKKSKQKKSSKKRKKH